MGPLEFISRLLDNNFHIQRTIIEFSVKIIHRDQISKFTYSEKQFKQFNKF